jgi:hypothetical protein
MFSVAAVACDQLPLLAPTGSKVVIHTDQTTLASNGTADVTATVLESSGTPVQNGTLVTFTTTLGQFDLREARTRNGSATVRLNAAGASGVAHITASSGGATSDAIDISIGTAAVDTIVVSASPATVPPTGGTVTLVATARGASGQGLSGVPVTFSATAGTVSPTTAVTNAAGEATTTLTTTQATTVTARAGTKESTATIALRTASTLTVTSSPPNPTTHTTVTFAVAPATGSILRDVTLDFGDGQSAPLGTLTGPVTHAHVYTSAGTFAVRASGTDVSGDPVVGATTIIVNPSGLTVSASPNPVVTGSSTTITITPSSGAVFSNVLLDFGDGSSQPMGTVSSATSVPHIYTTAGTFTARASSSGVSGSTSIVVTPLAPLDVSITTDPVMPRVNSVTTITATVTPSTAAVTSYRWNFGDGSAEETTTSRQTTHVYPATAVGCCRRITVTVTTQDGRTGMGQRDVQVIL